MKFLTENEKIDGPGAITIGMFDGLHLGHMALIERLKQKAQGLSTLIFTFKMKDESKSLYTAEEKKTLLSKTGVDYSFLQEYTPAFQNTDPESFLLLLKERYNMKVLAAGEDFRFGKGASGDADFLINSARRLGMSVEIVPPVLMGEEKVSSTRIRNLIEQGRVKDAAGLLGGCYFAAGMSEGIKTVNETFSFSTTKLTPKNGVYATWTNINGRMYPTVTRVSARLQERQIKTCMLQTGICADGDKAVVYFAERLEKTGNRNKNEALSFFTPAEKAAAERVLGNKAFTNRNDCDII